MKVTGPEATKRCQYDQIFSGLKVVTDGSVHRVQAIWDSKLSTKNWGFLLMDAKNVFNEINHIVMIFTVCHLSTYKARFVFNFCCHWSLLILKNGNGMVSFLHSRKGVTQGYPLVMLAYGIGISVLIKRLKAEFPEITHDWYADDAGALSTFTNTELYFNFQKNPYQDVGITPNPLKVF